MKLTIEQERQITAQYQYIKELATLKYDAEEKREQNLIQQSSQMQTAFSFMTAAVFAATAICIEYRGKLMPMSTSSWLIRSICSKISLELLV